MTEVGKIEAIETSPDVTGLWIEIESLKRRVDNLQEDVAELRRAQHPPKNPRE